MVKFWDGKRWTINFMCKGRWHDAIGKTLAEAERVVSRIENGTFQPLVARSVQR